MYEAFPAAEAHRILQRLEFHYTPKHASWLNMVEIEIGGCRVAVEVFEGNPGDSSTLASQVSKLRMRFRLKLVVLVGDRGMITKARIDADLKLADLDWITALRAPAIKALTTEGGPLHPRVAAHRR